MATKETKKSTSEFFSYMQSRIARLHRRGRFVRGEKRCVSKFGRSENI